ncbi:Type 1 phosphatases regulator ypi1 [Tulasnella sp. 330]|nr:Type 1 phosphatases regulator ypi1 [Tulasnella sp. 330]KAG8888111.1 Type 1 phosphatases regulator ypi1 [Tulasnella sp. 332]
MLGTRQRLQQQVAAPSAGSRTVTIAPEQPASGPSITNEEDGAGGPPRRAGVLKLRGGPRSRPQVAWTDDVVDNEGAGRKKSKICCIYHKPRAFDESSGESSGSDSESDDGHNHKCDDHEHSHGHARSRRNVPIGGGSGGGADGETKDVKGDVKNAYEAAPPVDKQRKGKGKE